MKKLLVPTQAIGLLMFAGCQSTMLDSMAMWKPGGDRTQATAATNPRSALAGTGGASALAKSASAEGSESGVELANFLQGDSHSAAKSPDAKGGLANGLKGGLLGAARESSVTDTLEKVLQQGHDHLADGRIEEAKAAYQRILNQQPNHVVANHRLAVIADQQHDFPIAEKHYLTALRVNDAEPNLLSDLGYSYLLQRRYVESEKYLKHALKVKPGHSKALNNLGLLYGKTGDYEQCLAAFRKAGSEADAQAKVASLFPLGPPPSSTDAFAGPSRPPQIQPAATDSTNTLQPNPTGVQMGAGGVITGSPSGWDTNINAQPLPQYTATQPSQQIQTPPARVEQPAPFPASVGNQLNASPTSQPSRYPVVPQGAATNSTTVAGGVAEQQPQQWPQVGSGGSGLAANNTSPSPTKPADFGNSAHDTNSQSSIAWPPIANNAPATTARPSQVWPPEAPVSQAQHHAPIQQGVGAMQPMGYQQAATTQPPSWPATGTNSTYGLANAHAQPQATGFPPIEGSPAAWNGGQTAPQQYQAGVDQAQRDATYLGMNAGPGAMFPMTNQSQPTAPSPQTYGAPSGQPFAGGAAGSYQAQSGYPSPQSQPPQTAQPSGAYNYQQTQVQPYPTAGQSTAGQQLSYQSAPVQSPAEQPQTSQQYSPWQN